MIQFNQYIESLQSAEYIGIVLLMLSTFIIGYFYGNYAGAQRKNALVKRLKQDFNELHSSRKVKSIQTTYTEVKSKNKPPVKEVDTEPTSKAVLHKERLIEEENFSKKNAITYLNFNQEKPEIDFDSIGYGDKYHPDALTNINGIGPYVEQKLNEIGIYNYDQLSRLKINDIRTLTSLIDFFPDRIERDNWVGQAKKLSKIKK